MTSVSAGITRCSDRTGGTEGTGRGRGRLGGSCGTQGTAGRGLGVFIDSAGTRGSGRMASTVEKRERRKSRDESALLGDVDDVDGALYH